MFDVPPRLKWLENSVAGRGWLHQLPRYVQACVNQWSLRVGPPYHQSYVSIVFPVTVADGSPAVLKIQFPHAESEYEAEALRRWNGVGAVQLLAHDPAHYALLIERCDPGNHLSSIHSDQALEVLTELLPRLWIPADKPFRSLREESSGWIKQLPESWERAGRSFEKDLLDVALEALETLSPSQGEQVLAHQDLHGDNVLRAQREPWLVIDPKPLSAEREFTLAPIIRDYDFGHSRKCVTDRLNRLSMALGLDRERARLWAFAQTLAWAFEGDRALQPHVETARWLRHA